MSNDFINNNDNTPELPPATEPYGRAAILLVESLIHGLIDVGAIDLAKAIAIVDTASDTASQMDHPETMVESITLLDGISKSLAVDLPEKRV